MNEETPHGRYPRLFSPLRIGDIVIPNRFVVPAVTTNFAEANGDVGDRLIDYLAARAEGGFGLVITENLGVHPTGRVMPRMGMADRDEQIPHLRRLAQAVKRHGAVLFGQISHAGRQTRSRITGHPLLAPSPIPCPLNREMPQELSIGQIDMLVEAYAAAARRLREAGFDGVEIHGAHGYLVAAFLSRYANRRTDIYGGSLDNRMRFVLRIVERIREYCGPGFPISVRISAEEFVEDGLTIEESRLIAQALEAAGVHAISVSVGVYESFNRLSMITGEEEGRWLHLAQTVRAGVSIPVMGVGRLKRAETAEKALESGQIDLAAFGRAAIADPALPAKARDGIEDRTIACIGCNICLGRSSRPQTICPVNPAVGDEARWRVGRSAAPATVLVEGGSIASLTAAWLAAERGHRVFVDTGGEPVGGMQAWRARVPGMEEYGETVRAVLGRAVRAGVTVGRRPPRWDMLWRERRAVAASADVLQIRPDAVTSAEILAREQVGGDGREAVVCGSDIAATEAAIRLASGGSKTTILTRMRDVAHDAHPGYREVCRKRLAALGVDVVTRAENLHELLAGFSPQALVVAGDPGSPDEAAPPLSYAYPYGAGEEPEPAWIDDAYEAGAMTAGIYSAADMVLALP